MTTERAIPAHAATVDLRDVVQLFRRNLGKIFFCVLAVVGLALLYLDSSPPIYAANALLEVAEGSRQNPAPTEVDTSDTLKTIERKIASQSVLLGVIRNLQLADDPGFIAPNAGGFFGDLRLSPRLTAAIVGFLRFIRAESLIDRWQLDQPVPPALVPLSNAELVRRLAAKITVGQVQGSRLITLRVEDHDPDKARRIAQEVIDEFFGQARASRRQDSANARELLLAEAQRVGADYKASQEKLEAYRHEYNAVSLQERQNIVVERLRELNQQVTTARKARLALEAQQAQAMRHADDAPEQLLGLQLVAEAPDVIEVRKQITLQDAQVATLGRRFGPLHPTLIQAKTQLERLRATLHATIRRAAERVRDSYASAKSTEDALEASLAAQEKAALELDRIGIPYHSLEREAQANATMYQKVLDNLKQFDVEHGLLSENDVNGIDIRIVEPPLLPLRPSRPHHSLWLAISTAAGLFLGCGAALVSHALDSTVSSIDEAESSLGRPVLATVLRTRRGNVGRRPLVVRSPASIQAEAFRSLRTSLSLLENGDPAQRCVLITSAVPREGKSFCSVNCAAAFAQQGLRTLLIDGDLRRPSLQAFFSHPNGKPDLSACLRDPSKFSQAVQPTPVENLFRLGDWRHQPGSAELVSKNGMREIIERALADFERVVIDSAPLMAVSDTLSVAKHVPTICVVVQASKTPRRLARRALQLLETVAHRTATGLILNKVSSRAAGDHYYYYNT